MSNPASRGASSRFRYRRPPARAHDNPPDLERSSVSKHAPSQQPHVQGDERDQQQKAESRRRREVPGWFARQQKPAQAFGEMVKRVEHGDFALCLQRPGSGKYVLDAKPMGMMTRKNGRLM